MMNRRGILRLFGAAPAIAINPTAAATAAGINPASLVAPIYGMSHGGCVPQSTSEADIATWILANGVPQFAKEAFRRDNDVTALDADLASARSFSLAAKIRMQRDRNVTHYEQKTISRQRTTLARIAFRKLTNFDFWP
jgi:hypothetical protein